METVDYLICIGKQENEEIFYQKLEKALQQLASDFKVGKLYKANSVEELQGFLKQCRQRLVLCCMEKLGEEKIGPGTIKKWMSEYSNVQVLLFMSDDKYAKGKINSLYKKGYYNACFNKDFTVNKLLELSLKSRTEKEAYDYYGIEEFERTEAVRSAAREKRRENEEKSLREKSDLSAPKGEVGVNAASTMEIEEKKSGESMEENKEASMIKEKDSSEKGLSETNYSEQQRHQVISEEITEAYYTQEETLVSYIEEQENVGRQQEESKKQKLIEDAKTQEEKKRQVREKEEFKESLGAQESEKVEYKKTVSTTPAKRVASTKKKKKIPKCVYYPGKEDDNEDDGMIIVENFHDDEELREFEEVLLNYFFRENITKLTNLWSGFSTKAEFESEVRKKIIDFHLPEDKEEQLFDGFHQSIFGYDYIEPFLYDKLVSDIKILSYDNIQLKYKGMRVGTNIKFRSPAHLDNFIEMCARKNNVILSDQCPEQTFDDMEHCEPAYLRFTISMKFVATFKNYYMHIRKTAKEKYSFDDLVAAGMFSPRFGKRMIEEFKEGKSFLISGKGSAGKTTLYNLLLDYFPRNKAGLLVQENMEVISSDHPNMMYMHVVKTPEGDQIKYSLKDISEKALLMDIDAFFISEVKGGEAGEALIAIRSGNQFMGTIHAYTAREALPNLVNYALYESKFSSGELKQMVSAIDYILHMDKFAVKECCAVSGWDSEKSDFKYTSVDIS